MGQVSNSSNGLDALTAGNAASAKVAIPHEPGLGCKLASGTVYYFALGGDSDANLQHTTLKWDASVIVTFSLECTSIPAKKFADGGDDLKAWDNTTGNGWNQEPLTSTSWSSIDTTGATGAATASGNTIVVTGGTAGSLSMHVGNLGSRRARIRADVKATGGYVRCNHASKE